MSDHINQNPIQIGIPGPIQESDPSRIQNPVEDPVQDQLRKTLRRIHESIQVDHKTFRELLGMSASRHAEVIYKKADISTYEIYVLANSLRVNVDLLFNGKLDYVALARQFNGDLSAIPDRYQNNSQKIGRARAASVIFSHLSLYHGEEYAKGHFRKLQLHPEAFTNPTEFVHPSIAMDLMKGLPRDTYTEDKLRGIGTMNFAMAPREALRLFAKLGTPQKLYSYIFEEWGPQLYDRMFMNKIERITSDRCRVAVRTTELAQSLFEGSPIDNRESCLYRQGVMSCFLAVFGHSFAQVEEVSCIHRGDPHCVIDLVWGNPKLHRRKASLLY